MSHGTSALKDAKNISSSLSRAQSQLEATLSQAESATAALHDDGSTIKVGRYFRQWDFRQWSYTVHALICLCICIRKS